MSRFIRDRLKTLAPYVPGEQPKGVTLIKLNTNESPFPPCPGVKACVGEVDRMQLYSDPDNTEITLAIAEHYGLSRENVICGNGSDEILAFFYMAYGDKPLTMPEISYGFYPVFAALLDTVPDRKPLKADFSVDINDYLTPGHNVVIANPNAPTGLTLSLDEIETILKAHP
ncbi:MAG: aminotransferase class I/II-fold pyridoxal phosphate-dependent enzyme, partial [Clostridia bacterium]|nr:aminotransferase class I/II-fold pyridoxal phosphate-dependent enzyme [Clostridia bacterium]